MISNVRPTFAERIERAAPTLFILPAVLVVLVLSLFPLVFSLFLSMSRMRLEAGGTRFDFVWFANFRKFITGAEQKVLVGTLGSPTLLGWLIFAAVVGLLIWQIVKFLRENIGAVSPIKLLPALIGKILNASIFAVLTWLIVGSLFATDGRPGTLVVTMLYVFVGVSLQYLIGLGLALLCVQQLPGRRFFRVVFLLPMMITPVGVGYLFRMLADTNKGPLVPIWNALGLEGFTWANNAWGARTAVMIGDIWQWTPFMFIVLVAALEALPVDPYEAAAVDGATGWQIFRNITLPAIVPVSATLVLIRLIEAFKIIDLPNILTNGGPGTATETMTLYAYRIWRAQDMGGSAALAYILLILVTVVATAYVNFMRSRVAN
jgi:multiple sugar transport system permease protein